MVFAIPLLTNRVAPRCTAADGLLLVTVNRSRVINQRTVPIKAEDMEDVVGLLRKHAVSTLVCGGISLETRERVVCNSISVVENVACSADEIVAALEAGELRPGLGFNALQPHDKDPQSGSAEELSATNQSAIACLNCLECSDRRCLRGEDCRNMPAETTAPPLAETCRILEAASDITFENERQLCRLSELVYFCLDMGYRKVGIAFCIELHEPASILADVLGRFFEVVSVCCKIGGQSLNQLIGTPRDSDTGSAEHVIACNPLAQAETLNLAGTDLNVVVGLCIGSDCIFTRASHAPVTALFVKDKSLANNPIGAVYSEYYLRESAAPDRPIVPIGPANANGSSRKQEEAS